MPFEIVSRFERALCDYTGAPYAVAVSSCTAALFLCCKYLKVEKVWLPRRTYVGVPMQVINAGGSVVFDSGNWRGSYSLVPYAIKDSARRFTSGMYSEGFECVSFHPTKICGAQGGGAILHDDAEADHWFKQARWHGRVEGIHPKNQDFTMCGWEFRMAPPLCQAALMKLSTLPHHNEDLPNDDYPDLSQIAIFK
jgi:dTDP-4-amino-4,6-dideoxygalactose transaminase